jgi:hypothetical protein
VSLCRPPATESTLHLVQLRRLQDCSLHRNEPVATAALISGRLCVHRCDAAAGSAAPTFSLKVCCQLPRWTLVPTAGARSCWATSSASETHVAHWSAHGAGAWRAPVRGHLPKRVHCRQPDHTSMRRRTRSRHARCAPRPTAGCWSAHQRTGRCWRWGCYRVADRAQGRRPHLRHRQAAVCVRRRARIR